MEIDCNDVDEDYPRDEQGRPLQHHPDEVGPNTGWILVLGAFLMAILFYVICANG